MNKLEELEERKQKCQTELEELHLIELSEYWYKIRRADLELHICNLEEAIEAEKEVLREKTAADNAFIIVLYAIVVTGLGILIFM